MSPRRTTTSSSSASAACAETRRAPLSSSSSDREVRHDDPGGLEARASHRHRGSPGHRPRPRCRCRRPDRRGGQLSIQQGSGPRLLLQPGSRHRGDDQQGVPGRSPAVRPKSASNRVANQRDGQKCQGGLEMSGHKGQVVGYVRVSTADQNEARQLEAIGEVDRLFSEKVSGKSREREQLGEMFDYVRDGDVVRVKSPDRLSRSTRDLLAMVEELRAKGVEIEFVDNPALNTDTPNGEFMLTILGAVAQLERSVARERQAEGIAIAKAKGTYDRPPALTGEQLVTARALVQQGVPKAEIARRLGVSRQTLYTALGGKGVYGAVD